MKQLLIFLEETPAVKLTVTVFVIAAVLVIIWLLLRNIRLWYWKTDKIIGSMDEMGERMDSLEKGMDSIKISTGKLMEENRITNGALLMLQGKALVALESGEEAADQASLFSGESEEAEGMETPAVGEQVKDLEKALQELRKQKEQLEADINAKIRD